MEKLLAELLAALQQGPKNIQEMNAGDAFVRKAKKLEMLFTQGVELLRVGAIPSVPVSALMEKVWDIIGGRWVSAAIGPDVPVLYFFARKKGVTTEAMILLPHRWDDMIAQDPVMQCGGLVFVGSQAVDYFNDRWIDQSLEVQKRAQAYEAEFLLGVKKFCPEWEPNEYQRNILAEFPQGICTPKVEGLLYSPREVPPQGAVN